jgi:hypothetical protein
VPAAEGEVPADEGASVTTASSPNADVITEALGFLEQADLLDSDVPECLDLGA